jgi:uncharacterized protein DUF3293
MPLSSELLTAYEDADYAVFTRPELVLRIGEPSPRLDALLEEAGAETAAYLSAANPRGERRPEAENKASHAVLKELIAASGYPYFPGEGRDPEGRWAPEPSFLVLGIYRDNAKLMGRLFGQNAIVFVEKGGGPRLVPLA